MITGARESPNKVITGPRRDFRLTPPPTGVENTVHELEKVHEHPSHLGPPPA